MVGWTAWKAIGRNCFRYHCTFWRSFMLNFTLLCVLWQKERKCYRNTEMSAEELLGVKNQTLWRKTAPENTQSWFLGKKDFWEIQMTLLTSYRANLQSPKTEFLVHVWELLVHSITSCFETSSTGWRDNKASDVGWQVKQEKKSVFLLTTDRKSSRDGRKKTWSVQVQNPHLGLHNHWQTTISRRANSVVLCN